ncbi:hypothetical protein SAMN05216232_1663 [Virgibacillus subterraneus]|uniref:Phosphoesterase n=1 Tax=Virgibacillus subterraneus TaxID=621109 RepID=A0A1H9DJG2_9BACI|nr:metallophosphoesterase [Virgibacillus subterraneus]SEQ13604.1 hypothetical protein SAMN05216232_1663 [Virgibacillus subterraneus]
MPSVLIVSDSHGSTNELKEIKERHALKYMIHCGDSELDMDAPELTGFIKVAGNCDFDSRYPLEQTSLIEGLRFYIAHGHHHHVKSNLMTITYRAEEEDAQVVCYGHTHIAMAEKVGNQLVINPGSILLPRVRADKTYAILKWDDLDAVQVNYYTVKGDFIEDLSLDVTFT